MALGRVLTDGQPEGRLEVENIRYVMPLLVAAAAMVVIYVVYNIYDMFKEQRQYRNREGPWSDMTPEERKARERRMNVRGIIYVVVFIVVFAACIYYAAVNANP